MSDSRSKATRRTPAGARREAVGGKDSGNTRLVFFAAVAAVVLSFVILVVVAADAFGGSDGDPSPVAPGDTATTEPTSPPSAGATTTTTTAQPASPTPEPTRGDDGKIVLPCGNILVPLDKDHRLTSDCAPNDLVNVAGARLRSEAAAAFQEMAAAAKQEKGYNLYINSGYRSYQEQVTTYNYWVSVGGQAQADRSSARPGHSEHQLGTTADVGANGCELECLSGTPEAAWIADNSWKYGFIVSYPDGKEQTTGYMFEPWHVRFVGKDVAKQVRDSGLTLHEFLLR